MIGLAGPYPVFAENALNEIRFNCKLNDRASHALKSRSFDTASKGAKTAIFDYV